MTDLKLLTVRALRELAKKHLGTGHSRLKTKAELIAALSKAMPKDAKVPAPAASAAKPAAPAKPAGRAARAASPEKDAKTEKSTKPSAAKARASGRGAESAPPEAGRARLEQIAAKYVEKPVATQGKTEGAPPIPAAESKPAPKTPEPKAGEPVPPSSKASGAKPVEPKTPATAGEAPSARIRPADSVAPPMVKDTSGETVRAGTAPEPKPVATGDEVEADEPEANAEAEEARAKPPEVEQAEEEAEESPPPRKISAAEQALIDENLGDLPVGYQDDSVALMARDPHTLWLYWDFAEQTARHAREGLPHSHPVLRLYDGARLVREVEIALDARSWYLYNVQPGRQYRAEIHFVAPNHRSHRLGPPSNPIQVPPEGPSPVVDDRFIALPFEVPLQQAVEALQHPHPGEPFPPEKGQELMERAESALREELPAPPPGHGPEIAVLPASAPPPPGGEASRSEEFVVTRRLGSSDMVSERYRRWFAAQPEGQPPAERTRFGGRWTSSRPA